MKYSAFYPIVAGLVLGATLLSSTALAEKRTPFTATQASTWWNSATAPALPYAFDVESQVLMESTESRVAGSAFYLTCAIDLNTGSPTYWGKLHISNEGGAWEGYWTGTKADGFTATLAGSGDYEGLVSRWTAPLQEGTTITWSGYIVENGPIEVPFKMSGWRIESSMPITDPTKMPFYVRASLDKGEGQASHIGVFRDVKEVGVGLIMAMDPESRNIIAGKSRGMGMGEAANGDLFTWVSSGEWNSGEFKFKIFLTGGTGRFEHAVGCVAGQVKWTTPPSGTYEGTGKIRY